MHRPQDPATNRQLSYLKKLGYDLLPGQRLTKQEASDLIDTLMPEADRRYFQDLNAPKAVVVDLSDFPLTSPDLSTLRLKQLDELQPPEEWKFRPAHKDQIKYLSMYGVVPNGQLTAGQASDLIQQISELQDRQRWDAASENDRQRILRDKYLASYLRADCEKAAQELAAARQANDEDSIIDAELDLEEAEKVRLNFWKTTFSEKLSNALDQSFDLFSKHGHQFRTPTKAQIKAVLDALDAASPTWDKESPGLFYETLELNFPDRRRP